MSPNGPSSGSHGGSSDTVQRGGAGMEKTAANPDGGNPNSSATMDKTKFNPADEPDFAKKKPGNPPHMLTNIIEGLTEGTSRSS